jgi:hypothetical protein
MMKTFVVNVWYDDTEGEIPMWLAQSNEIVGLNLANIYLDQLIEDCDDVAPELLRDNCKILDDYTVKYEVSAKTKPAQIKMSA